MTHSHSQATILKLFREADREFVSGARISAALGVSRTAVWKQIGQLRQLGYQIEAAPAKGYRLLQAPDVLLAAEVQNELGTACIGREVVFYSETDSTNLRVHELGKSGVAEGVVVIADAQNAGRGRMGRSWLSPPGVNLYLSVLLRPAIAPRHACHLTFLSAVAVARTVAAVGEVTPQVKWPNDILVNGRKLAGLLNELDAETDRIRYLVLGIGVNLNMAAEQFPDDLRYPATSLLLERGEPVSRQRFTRTLLRTLDELYGLYRRSGFAPIMAAWQAYFDLVERQVEVDCQEYRLRGKVAGLGEDGALLLELADGRTERVLAGDVRPL